MEGATAYRALIREHLGFLTSASVKPEDVPTEWQQDEWRGEAATCIAMSSREDWVEQRRAYAEASRVQAVPILYESNTPSRERPYYHFLVELVMREAPPADDAQKVNLDKRLEAVRLRATAYGRTKTKRLVAALVERIPTT